MLYCVNAPFNFGIGAAAQKVMLLVSLGSMTAKQVPVETQWEGGWIESFCCNGLCRCSTEKCRNFRLRFGIELAVQDLEGESGLENLTQSTDRIFRFNLIISNTISKLTEQVQIDGRMDIGQCGRFLSNLSKDVVSVEFRWRRLIEF